MQGIVINGISKCKDWKICMKNMHSIFLKYHANNGGKDTYIGWGARSNYTNQIGISLYIFINPCSFFHQNVFAHTLTKLTRNLWVDPKNKMPTKACIPFFQTLRAFSFLHFIFWNSCNHFCFILFYFILFYFSPWYLTSTLNWSHRKKIKQLYKNKQWASCCATTPSGPIIIAEHPGPRLLGTLHKMFHGETRGASHYGLAIYIKKYLKAKKKELWKLKYFTM